MQLGAHVLRNGLFVAPMAGVTDSSFLRLIKELGGVGLIVTEFISVEGITRGNMRTHRMMKFLPEERPLSIQIFGYDDARMIAAAEPAHAEKSREIWREAHELHLIFAKIYRKVSTTQTEEK